MARKNNRDWTDPTKNVRDLNKAGLKHEAAMRELNARWQRRLSKMQAEHATQLREAEKTRLDAIREVDVAAVRQQAAAAERTAQVLADQLRATAEQARVGLAAALDPIAKDIADLRRAQYEAQGSKGQQGETRLNVGAILGGLSVLLVLVFGVIGLILAANP